MARMVSQNCDGKMAVTHRYTRALEDEMSMRAISSICTRLDFDLGNHGKASHSIDLAKKFFQGRRLLLESSDLNSLFAKSRQRKRWAISGYFQDNEVLESQVEHVARLMRLHLDSNSQLGSSSPDKFIGLHVRLGDYTALTSIYGKSSPRYYRNALSILQRKGERLPIVVVSDDKDGAMQFVSQFLDKSEFEMAPNAGSPIEDFALLSRAQHLIAPSSTFSWWASRVGNSETIFLPSPLLLDSKKNRRINLNSPNANFLER